MVAAVDFQDYCCKYKDHSQKLLLVDFMTKMDDVDYHSKALPGRDNEGRNMLLEKFNHAIDD